LKEREFFFLLQALQHSCSCLLFSQNFVKKGATKPKGQSPRNKKETQKMIPFIEQRG
jgi:hypothetical protein